MTHVVHVINELDPGGTELVLDRLLAAIDDPDAHSVVSLTDVGIVGERLRGRGIEVTALGGVGWRLGLALVRLTAHLRRHRPQVVQTWLYRSDIVGGLAARLASVRPVVWNVRQSAVESSHSGRGTAALIRLGALLSRFVPDAVVFVGRHALDEHRRVGYRCDRMLVIPNGVEVEAPAVDRAGSREALGLPPGAFVVSRVGRYHWMKDPDTLLAGFRRLLDLVPDAVLVCCGTGMDAGNASLARVAEAHGVEAGVRLLGHLEDPAPVVLASDVACSPSLAEGFPNAVAEAMACGIPVVATDVGDTRDLVGDAGRIVPARDPAALGDALAAVAAMSAGDRRALGERGRRRVAERYSMEAMAARYVSLYEELSDVRH